MDIILWILFGALAGWIASMIMNTNEEQGAIGNIVVGIAGAVLGGWLYGALTSDEVSGFSLMGLIVAVIGSCILLAVVKAVRGRRPNDTVA